MILYLLDQNGSVYFTEFPASLTFKVSSNLLLVFLMKAFFSCAQNGVAYSLTPPLYHVIASVLSCHSLRCILSKPLMYHGIALVGASNYNCHAAGEPRRQGVPSQCGSCTRRPRILYGMSLVMINCNR